MAGWGHGVVAGLAVLLVAAGWIESAGRAGPYDVTLAAARVPFQADGTYHAQASDDSALCAVTTCAPTTDLDLRLRGLPAVPFTARLEGTAGTVDLGPLRRGADGTQQLQWSRAEDHTDKGRLVLLVAGLPAHAWPVGPSPQPQDLRDGEASLGWGGWRVHVNEIGGVEVSTVGTSRVPVDVPPGWSLEARLLGRGGAVVLGTFDAEGDVATLDGRVERVRLERQHGGVAVLVPEQGGALGPDGLPAAFPVAGATLP